jgi:signal transduction histidine kinase
MSEDTRFPELVAIACHDLRTPLATVHGFAHTLGRADLEEPAARYVEMIAAATAQLAELLEELSLVKRIEAGRYEPRLEDVDSLELAHSAAAELEESAVAVSGSGAPVHVERKPATRALRQLARAARRHGGHESVALAVRGAVLELAPVERNAADVVTGADVRELGAAAAVVYLRALGSSLEHEHGRLVIRLPEGG